MTIGHSQSCMCGCSFAHGVLVNMNPMLFICMLCRRCIRCIMCLRACSCGLVMNGPFIVDGGYVRNPAMMRFKPPGKLVEMCSVVISNGSSGKELSHCM